MTLMHQSVASSAVYWSESFLKNYVGSWIFNAFADGIQTGSKFIQLEWLVRYLTGGQLAGTLLQGATTTLSVPLNFAGRVAVMSGVDALYGWRVPFVLETARIASALRKWLRTNDWPTGLALTDVTDSGYAAGA